MNATATITAAASEHSDQLIADSIRLIDATLAAMADKSSDEARAQRMVRASLYAVLEDRHPHVIAALDDWATCPDGSDARTYTDVILETLGL